MNSKQKVLAKIAKEIARDIGRLKDLATQASLSEVWYFIYLMRILRSLRGHADAQDDPQSVELVSLRAEEALYYLIPMLMKHGRMNIIADTCSSSIIVDGRLTQGLQGLAAHIQAKNEMSSLVALAEATPYGPDDRYAKVDLSFIARDTGLQALFDYFVRLDSSTIDFGRELTNVDAFLQKFEEDFNPFPDELRAVFGVTAEEYTAILRQLFSTTAPKFAAAENAMLRPDGRIEVNTLEAFNAFAPCFVRSSEGLFSDIGERGVQLLEKLVFDPLAFDETELRYFHLWRKPILRDADIWFVSPELLLDSLFINAHYTLLEADRGIGESYKAKMASRFLDRLEAIAAEHGYEVKGREIDLFEGKIALGDVDLLIGKEDHPWILIEAKHHALPLAVYSHDLESTRKHLERLKDEWEKKVLRRVRHLKVNARSYGISEDFTYLIVTRQPEVLSHHSALMVLSEHEFQEYLTDPSVDFSKLYEKLYPSGRWSMELIATLQRDGFLLGSFE